MQNLKLIEPSLEYREEIEKFRQEIMEEAYSKDKFSGCSKIEAYEKLEDWLEFLDLQGRGLVEGRVPASAFLIVEEETDDIVGILDIRFSFGREQALKSRGNIGLTIILRKRNLGYGTQAIKMALEKCRDCGLSKVMICCREGNIGSRTTIERNGGKLGEVEERNGELHNIYWIEL